MRKRNAKSWYNSFTKKLKRNKGLKFLNLHARFYNGKKSSKKYNEEEQEKEKKKKIGWQPPPHTPARTQKHINITIINGRKRYAVNSRRRRHLLYVSCLLFTTVEQSFFFFFLDRREGELILKQQAYISSAEFNTLGFSPSFFFDTYSCIFF